MKKSVGTQQLRAATNLWCQAAHPQDLGVQHMELYALLQGDIPVSETLLQEALRRSTTELMKGETGPKLLSDEPSCPTPRTPATPAAGKRGS